MSNKEFIPRAAIVEKLKMLVAQKKKAHGVAETAPIIPAISVSKAGRNDPCPCGSGKKYKKCCALKGGVA